MELREVSLSGEISAVWIPRGHSTCLVSWLNDKQGPWWKSSFLYNQEGSAYGSVFTDSRGDARRRAEVRG